MAKKEKGKKNQDLRPRQPQRTNASPPRGEDLGEGAAPRNDIHSDTRRTPRNHSNPLTPSYWPDTVILYCLYALVGLLPLAFFYPTYDIFELTKLTVLRLITLTMLGAWSWKIFLDRTVKIARTPIDWFVLTYLAVFTLATIFSKNPVLSLLGEYGRFEGLLAILNYGAIFLLAGSLIRDNKAIPDTRAFIRSLILTAIAAADIVSVYGVFQRFGVDFFIWSSAGTDLTRAFSTMGNPIYIAAYLTIVLSVAICLFLSEPALKARLYLGSSIVLMTLTLVFTFSRAGWAGFLFSLIILISLSLVTNYKYPSSEPQSNDRDESRGIIDKKRLSRDSVIASSDPNSVDSVIARSERERATKQPRQTHSSPMSFPEYSSSEERSDESRSTGNNKRLTALSSPLMATLALVTIVAFVVVLAVSLSVSYGSAPTKSTISRALSAFDPKSAGVVERISLWKSSAEMIKDRPWLGWGPDTFGTYFTKYRRQDLVDFEYNVTKLATPRHQNRPHSDILQQSVSAGLLGLAAYLALILAYFYFALKRLLMKDSSTPRGEDLGEGSIDKPNPNLNTPDARYNPNNLFDRALLIGIIAGLAGYFLQIQFSFSTIAVTPQVWLLMALTFVIGAKDDYGTMAEHKDYKEYSDKIGQNEGQSDKSLESSLRGTNTYVGLELVEGSQDSGRTPFVSPNLNNPNTRYSLYTLSLPTIPRSLLVLLVLFVFLVISIGAFFSVRPLVADYYFDQGLYALENADASLAKTSIDRALALNPYDAEYANFAASSFTDAAKSSSNTEHAGSLLLTSISYEDTAISLNPDMPGYHYNLGNALYYYASLPDLDKPEVSRDYKAAVKEFELAIAGDPKNVDAHLILASAYLRLGRKADAISEIRQALVINPGRAQTKTWLETLEKN